MSNILEPYSEDVLIYNSEFKISSYLKGLNVIKEFIINSWDADTDKIKISLDSEKVIIEDWGIGIENFKRFWSIGNQHKTSQILTPRFRRKPIGSRGFGKISYIKIGNKIFVETRTREKVENSFVDYSKMKFYVQPLDKDSDALDHIGTRITISEFKKPLDKDKIINYIKKELYGLILPIASKNNLEIFVNNKKIKPEVRVGIRKKISSQFGEIKYGFFPATVSKIDILYRGIKISEIHPKVKLNPIGYVNVDRLNFVSNGYKIEDTEEFHPFLIEIKKLIQKEIIHEKTLRKVRKR